MNLNKNVCFDHILTKYHNYIKLHSNNSEDIEQELSIFLWNLLKYTKKISFNSPECFDYYIKKSIKRESWKLINKEVANKNRFVLAEYIENIEDSNEFLEIGKTHLECEEIEFDDFIKHLKEQQKLVMKLKYYYNFSDIEIGNIMNLSRQRINAINRACLDKLRNYKYIANIV